MFCVRPVLLWRRMPWIVLSSKIVQVRRESAAESVPAVPRGKGIVALEYVAFGFVFFLRLPADRAARNAGEITRRARSSRLRGFPFPAWKIGPTAS